MPQLSYSFSVIDSTLIAICIHRLDVNTVKPVLSGRSKKTIKLVFETNYCLMQVKVL